MKKLTLNKRVISTLTKEEAKQIMGGAITYGCQTQIIEGCDLGHSWNNCSNACSGYCGGSYGCPPVTQPYPGGATCDGCQTDYACG